CRGAPRIAPPHSLEAGTRWTCDLAAVKDVEARKEMGQVGCALAEYQARVGAVPARRAVAVAALQFAHRAQAGGDLAEGGEALFVERGMIGQVDEYLGGA